MEKSWNSKREKVYEPCRLCDISLHLASFGFTGEYGESSIKPQ